MLHNANDFGRRCGVQIGKLRPQSRMPLTPNFTYELFYSIEVSRMLFQLYE